mmetsp:Transcript_83616/g.167467  ORF Transcript_83616/g.167467 Transcript_83616/m.167467 type:complete len:239 (+) Transcript_83616:852-1568(+)
MSSCCMKVITSNTNSQDSIRSAPPPLNSTAKGFDPAPAPPTNSGAGLGANEQRSMPRSFTSHKAPHSAALEVDSTQRAMAESPELTMSPDTSNAAPTRTPLVRQRFHADEWLPMCSRHTLRDRASPTTLSTPRSTRVACRISQWRKERYGVMGKVRVHDSSSTRRQRSGSLSPLPRSAKNSCSSAARFFVRKLCAASRRSSASFSALSSTTNWDSLATYAFFRNRVFRACSRFRSFVI